jgi:hypothetical protein
MVIVSKNGVLRSHGNCEMKSEHNDCRSTSSWPTQISFHARYLVEQTFAVTYTSASIIN